jgi:DNA-binding XRE family transcriptional regulator
MSGLRKSVGRNIRAIRAILGLRQRQFGAIIDRSAATIVAVERDRSSLNRKDEAVLVDLGISQGFIFGDDKPMFSTTFDNVKRNIDAALREVGV